MTAPRGTPEKKIVAALRKHAGIIILAANDLGVSRQAVWERVQKSPKLKALLVQIEEEHLDIGEGHVVSGLRTGDKFYVDMYLKQKGKRRGYGNRVENSIDETQFEALVSALGGSPDRLRAALLRLGIDPEAI
jgi:hypothetical protein